MIREILTYLTESPSLKEAKKLGHLVESISLLSRESRCQKAWLPHRTECKNFISSQLSKALHYDSVLVLGSGPMHELPIELLSKTFKRVVLVDIVHLKSTKKSVAHLTNLEFIEHDITEIEAELLQGRLTQKVPEGFMGENWGMVFSVNLMSQLPLHLRSYIHKKLDKKFTESEISDYLAFVTKNHWLYLKNFKCPVLLITDTHTYYYDLLDQIVHTEVNYAHLNLPVPALSWNWFVAPIPEFQKDLGMKMLVSGFVLKNTNSH